MAHGMKHLLGNRYGMLTVVSNSFKIGRWTYCNVKCDCGVEKSTSTARLLCGRTISCGCYRMRGNLSRSIEYSSYSAMIDRCTKPNHKSYEDYKSKGITICDRWLGRNGFLNFYHDMGRRPSREYQLDRYPNKYGNYEPSNCRWATVVQQQRNKDNNVYLIIDGQYRNLSEWCEVFGVPYVRIWTRWNKYKLEAKELFLPTESWNEYRKTLPSA